MLYFCRRGRQNLRQLKKTDFVISTYEDSIFYRYDVLETEQARISCVHIANQNRAGDTNV